MSEFYDNGTVKAAITSRECKEKPGNRERDFPRWTAFQDWFDTQGEAESFLVEVRAMETKEAVA
jgi:hypothetical protein